MIEVKIDSIRASLLNQHRIILLKALHSDRFLPLFIGQAEAETITTELQSPTHERPLPLDLLNSVISELDAQLDHVLIHDIRKDVFYAYLVIQVQDKKKNVDARPSDAIALAVRAKVPMFVTDAIMDQFAVRLEEES